jgi:hypothetical protein
MLVFLGIRDLPSLIAPAGNAVVNVYINREKNFSFVEFRTGELCGLGR